MTYLIARELWRVAMGGMAAYPPMVMAAVCVMIEAERTTYRKMVGDQDEADKNPLQNHDSTLLRTDPGVVPDTGAPDSHLLGGCRSLAYSSTRFSYLRFVRWFDVRADRFQIVRDDRRTRREPGQDCIANAAGDAIRSVFCPTPLNA